MIRMTERQFEMFRKPGAKRSARTPKPRESLPENIVKNQVLDFLSCRNWQVTRNHVGTFVPYRCFAALLNAGKQSREVISIGRKGDLDWVAMRPVPAGYLRAQKICVLQQMFYFETKAPGRKPSPEQQRMIERHHAAGHNATWFDSLEMFVEWYTRMEF